MTDPPSNVDGDEAPATDAAPAASAPASELATPARWEDAPDVRRAEERVEVAFVAAGISGALNAIQAGLTVMASGYQLGVIVPFIDAALIFLCAWLIWNRAAIGLLYLLLRTVLLLVFAVFAKEPFGMVAGVLFLAAYLTGLRGMRRYHRAWNASEPDSEWRHSILFGLSPKKWSISLALAFVTVFLLMCQPPETQYVTAPDGTSFGIFSMRMTQAPGSEEKRLVVEYWTKEPSLEDRDALREEAELLLPATLAAVEGQSVDAITFGHTRSLFGQVPHIRWSILTTFERQSDGTWAPR